MSTKAKHPALINLRTVLVDLYKEQADQRRVADDAGLNLGTIRFDGKAINDWNTILEQAIHQQKLEDILAVVASEYGETSNFFCAELWWLISQVEQGEAKLAEFYTQMRQKHKLALASKPLVMLESLYREMRLVEGSLLLNKFVVQLITQGSQSPHVEHIRNWLDRVFSESQLLAQQENSKSKYTLQTPKLGEGLAQLQAISTQQGLTPYGPRLWNTNRPVEPDLLQVLMQRHNLCDNPFGPLQAELDNFLPNFAYISPKFENAITGARPSVLFGAAGTGKTAHALWLAYSCMNPILHPREPDTFQVYINFTPDDIASLNSTNATLHAIRLHLGSQLIRYVATKPHSLLEHTPENRAAIASAMLDSTGTRATLLSRLAQSGLTDTKLYDQVTAELNRYDAPDLDENNGDQRWLDTLARARPKNFLYTYLLIDLHSRNLLAEKHQENLQFLRLLFQQIIPLASQGIYLKLFLPAELQADSAQTLLRGIKVTTLQWSTVELRRMLMDRLQWASNGSVNDLNNLFDQPSRRTNPSPMARLIDAAQGNPQKLIELGNRLLEQHAEKYPDRDHFTLSELESIG